MLKWLKIILKNLAVKFLLYQKCEKPQAVENLEEIVKVSDGIIW